MPDFRRANCKNCKRHRDECGPLSWSGLCAICGPMLAEQNADDLHFHRGEGLRRWRLGMAASIGAVLVDEADESA